MRNNHSGHPCKKRRGGGRMGSRKHGRRGSRGRLFAAGEMRLAFLDLLNDGPAHGYELMQRLAEKTDGRYEPSAGATYPLLQQLLDEGLADVEVAGSKKVYNLIDAGRSLVVEHRDELDAIWQRVSSWRQWSGLEAPELADMGELKMLIRTTLDKLQDVGTDQIRRTKLRAILADSTEEVRAV